MDNFKDFILNKLVLRLIYILGAYSASHVVALAESQNVQGLLNKIPGIVISLKVTDVQALQTWITVTLLTLGEVAFHFFHKQVILPQVSDKISIQGPASTLGTGA